MKVDFLPQQKFDVYTDALITRALDEDIGEGDHTSLSTIPENATLGVQLLAKDIGVVAGVRLAVTILKQLDSHIDVRVLIEDGEKIKEGDIVFKAFGNARAILTAERLLLNFMQHLSGIASKTFHLAEMIKPYGTRLLDTRKTIPGLRYLEKWAVAVGGGTNHRIGLFDMILIKDNHVDYAGSITQAVKSAQAYIKNLGKDLKIEVEVRNFDELEELLSLAKVDRVLLDNFCPADMAKAIRLINGRLVTEASGGIDESNIVDYAKTGVDFISVGALTHTIQPLDLSLKVMKDN